jgi:hypothetical protein
VDGRRRAVRMNHQNYDAHRPGISAAAAECRMTPAAYCRWGESDRRAVIQNSGVDGAKYCANQRDAKSIGDHQFEQSPQTFGWGENSSTTTVLTDARFN